MSPQPEDYYRILQSQRNEALDRLVNAEAEIEELKRQIVMKNSQISALIQGRSEGNSDG